MKVVYDDWGEVTVTYHPIQDVCHIADTFERAVEIGDDVLNKLSVDKSKENT